MLRRMGSSYSSWADAPGGAETLSARFCQLFKLCYLYVISCVSCISCVFSAAASWWC